MNRLAYALLATVFVQLCGMFTGIVSARLLGPEGRGLLALLISFSGFLFAAGSLSVPDALVFRVARSNQDHERRQWLSAALALGAATSLVTTAVAWLLVPVLLSSPDEHLRLAILLALFLIPLVQLSNIFVAYFQVEGSAELWTFLRICPPLTSAALTAAYVASGFGRSVEWYVVLPLAGSTLVLACCALQLWRGKSGLPSPKLRRARKLLSFGLMAHPSVIGTLREEADRLVISFFLSMAALGQYSVAATLPMLIFAAAVTCDMVLFPRLASTRDPAAARLLFLQAVRAAIMVLFAVSMLMAVGSVLLIPMLFGEDYRTAATIAPVMCLTLFLASVRYVIGSAYKAFGRPFLHARGDLAALTASVLLIPTGITLLGLIGAALAVVLGQVVALALATEGIRRGIGVRRRLILSFSRDDIAYLAEGVRALWERRT